MTTDDWGGKSPTSLSSSRRKTDNKRCSHSQQIAAVGEAVIKRSRLPALSRYQQAPLANSVFSPPTGSPRRRKSGLPPDLFFSPSGGTVWTFGVHGGGTFAAARLLMKPFAIPDGYLGVLIMGWEKSREVVAKKKEKLEKDPPPPSPVLLPSSWVNKEPLEPCNQLCPTQTLSHERKRSNTNR